MSDHAKKKFTFKPFLLFIEDSIFLKDITREKRLENMKKIKNIADNSGFMIYFTLIENVRKRLDYIWIIRVN
jgi:hypothetical protein